MNPLVGNDSLTQTDILFQTTFLFLFTLLLAPHSSLSVYGAQVDQVQAPLGEAVTQSQLEAALSKKKYKLVTFTHVDTSTGVLSDAKMIGETVKCLAPDTLVRYFDPLPFRIFRTNVLLFVLVFLIGCFGWCLCGRI